MNTLINLVLKFSGLGKLWDVLDGYKTYLSAAIAILTGLLGVLQELAPLLSAHDASGLLTLAKGLPHDQSWMILVAGLGTLGIGHKLSKAASADDSPAPAPATPPAS